MTNLYGISQDADDLIVSEEMGGRQYYEATESHPTWPGGASGVTIGNGYDTGYSTPEEIAADWGPVLSAQAVAALQSVAGIRGSPAHSHAHELHWIDVPWDAAMAVYHNRDLPKWVGICERALPNFDLLHPDQKGAIVSLAFNRGASFDLVGDRYSEMRSIKADMEAKAFNLVPGEFLAMRRLWPVGGDLWKRRGHEAALFGRQVRGSVWWVQFNLNQLGTTPPLTVDGEAGHDTLAAVQVFRSDNNLPDVGTIDDELCNAIDARLAPNPSTS